MKKFFILFHLLLISASSFTQTNKISHLLDDRGRTDASDIIKTDFAEILQANIPIFWEHRFKNNIAIAGGIGYLSQKIFRPTLTPLLAEKELNRKLSGGYSLFLMPMSYTNGFESMYFGIPLHYKRYGNQASSFEVTIASGKQWFLGRHIALDAEFGIGANFEYSLDGKSYIYSPDIIDKNTMKFARTRIVFPLTVKIGYVL